MKIQLTTLKQTLLFDIKTWQMSCKDFLAVNERKILFCLYDARMFPSCAEGSFMHLLLKPGTTSISLQQCPALGEGQQFPAMANPSAFNS